MRNHTRAPASAGSLTRRIAAVALVAAWAAPTPAAESPLTPKHLAKLRTVVQARISPDGGHVAYVLSVPRRLFKDKDGPAWTELHVVDRQGNARPYLTGKVNVSRIDWTPDGKAISYLAKRGDDKRTALYTIPLAGGESRRVLSHSTGIKSYSWDPEGDRVAFTGVEERPKDQKKLRDKGFKQQVFEEDWRPLKVWIAKIDPAADEDKDSEKPRALELEGSASTVHWSPRGNRLAVALAPTPFVDDAYMNRKVSVVDPETGELHGRIEPPGKMGSFAWSPDGKHLALIVTADRNDPREGRLVVASAQGGEYRDLLPGLEGHVTAVDWRDAETVLFVADIGVVSAFGEVRHDGSAQGMVIPADDGRVLRGLSLARGGDAVAMIGQSSLHPAEAFLLKQEERRPVKLTENNPWLKETRLASQEVVSFETSDGLRLQGILIRPLDEEEGKKYPLILMVHGGPESHVSNGWVTRYAYPGQVAAAQGFAVFYPNYRGSTGRGVEFSKLDHGDPAGLEFDDLIAAVDHLVETGLVDRDRVGITGGSYGGYASAWGATRHSDRFAASVMFVGISDAISKAGTTDIPNEIFLVHHRKRVWEDWQFFLERSPIYYVQQAKTPILIMHGKNDPRVPPSQSLELYRLLKLAGKAPVRLVLYPGEGHGNRRAASRYDYNLRLMRWMEHYLKGPGGEPPRYELDYGMEEEKDKEEKESEESKG